MAHVCHTKVGKRVGLSFYYGCECTRPRGDSNPPILSLFRNLPTWSGLQAARGAASSPSPGRGPAIARRWAQTQDVSRPETCGGCGCTAYIGPALLGAACRAALAGAYRNVAARHHQHHSTTASWARTTKRRCASARITGADAGGASARGPVALS